MKNSLIASIAVTAGLFAVSAQAATVDMGFDVKSAYVSSGCTYNDSAVVQPWVGISDLKVGDVDLPLALGFWGVMDLGSYSADSSLKRGRFSEIDFNVDLDLASLLSLNENVSLMIGYLEYNYPRSGSEQDNLFVASAGYDLGVFAPYVTSKYFVGGSNEGKWELYLGAGRDFTLATISDTDLTLSCSAEVLYTYTDPDDAPSADGFSCATFGASLGYGIGYIGAEYVWRLDNGMLPSEPFGYEVKWIFSAGLAYTF